MSQDYDQYKESLRAEQEAMTREEIAEKMANESEYSIDLDALKSVKHIWVDRGLVMSCEGANHPSHRHFKVGKSRV